jgi:hypothetical protein
VLETAVISPPPFPSFSVERERRMREEKKRKKKTKKKKRKIENLTCFFPFQFLQSKRPAPPQTLFLSHSLSLL